MYIYDIQPLLGLLFSSLQSQLPYKTTGSGPVSISGCLDIKGSVSGALRLASNCLQWVNITQLPGAQQATYSSITNGHKTV